MRFGYLTYGLDRPPMGIGRSVLELGRALARHPECEPVYITPYRTGPFAEDGTPHAHLRGARLLPGLMTLGMLQLPLVARSERLPLVHDPTGVAPFLLGRLVGPYKRVVTLYDAIAFRNPAGYPWFNNFVNRRYVPAALPHVDAVITISQAAKADLVAYLDLPADRVHVVPWAPTAGLRPVERSAAVAMAARYGVRPPYVLYVGALEARKNVHGLLRAFAALRPSFPSLTLVIAGKPRWKHRVIADTLASLRLGDAVRFTGYVPDADLPALYSAADVFCFPSFYEGFGLPVLEAMACGTPVACANASSLPEAAGDAALLFDPHDPADIAAALARVLQEPPLARRLRERGLARAAEFSWERTAEQTVAVYNRVLAG